MAEQQGHVNSNGPNTNASENERRPSRSTAITPSTRTRRPEIASVPPAQKSTSRNKLRRYKPTSILSSDLPTTVLSPSCAEQQTRPIHPFAPDSTRISSRELRRTPTNENAAKVSPETPDVVDNAPETKQTGPTKQQDYNAISTIPPNNLPRLPHPPGASTNDKVRYGTAAVFTVPTRPSSRARHVLEQPGNSSWTRSTLEQHRVPEQPTPSSGQRRGLLNNQSVNSNGPNTNASENERRLQDLETGLLQDFEVSALELIEFGQN
ncbi:hypothetical protein HMN09_00315900 [Mycena chlorophos]|uniref:Uncharacterized protein n=1 Tax=Mycena chlorophos TaxID=658473 RepID=A0A8H6TFT7_MYCCL|nr:hypothetical protein HMN09_00315900 [Mycena chlorophos]